MTRIPTLTAIAALSLAASSFAQEPLKPSESGAVPPKTWVDKDTGHRVWRVSDEPNSGAFYFNVNAYTPPTASRWSTTPPAASWSSTSPP